MPTLDHGIDRILEEDRTVHRSTTRRSVSSSAFGRTWLHGQRDHREGLQRRLFCAVVTSSGPCSSGLWRGGCDHRRRQVSGAFFRHDTSPQRCWLDGHNRAFVFFGGVPQSILYDNDKCLVSRILSDGTRQRTRAFSGLQSHYLFEDRYGRPGKGNDKGNVEGVVGYARRNFSSWDAFNGHLEEQCRNRQGNVRGHRESIGERFVRDREALKRPLPAATSRARGSTAVPGALPDE